MKKIIGIFLTLAVAVALWTVPVKADDKPDMIVYSIDLKGAKGDATLVESDGEFLLMDTGVADAWDTLDAFLKSKGVTRLSVYVSHFHSDHAGNLKRICESTYYTVDSVYMPEREQISLALEDAVANGCADSAEISSTQGSLNLWDAVANPKKLEKWGIKEVVVLKKGSTFKIGKAEAEVIGPTKYYLASEFPVDPASLSSETQLEHAYNNSSLVTMITANGVRYLNAGDMEVTEEKAIIKAGVDVRADIFKMNHHGTDTSNSAAFLKKCKPKYSFSSYYCNAPELKKQNQIYDKNKLSELHVDDKTAKTTVYGYIRTFANMREADKYGEVFRTQFNGDITFTVKDGKVSYDAPTCFKTKGKKTFFYKNGVLQKGAIKGINESFYMTDKKGAIKTGLLTYKGKKYMCTGTHGMARIQEGIIKYNGKYYYSWYTPYLATGWRYINEKKYYFDPDKAYALTGKQTVDGVAHTFTKQGVLQPKG